MSNYKRYYMENHYIFITVVTYNRLPILIDNFELLRESFHKTILKYNYELYAGVILPEHFHIIIKPQQPEDFSKIIGSIKKSFTYNLNLKNCDNNGASKRRTLQNESRNKRKESYIWQRRFYEHIIRNDDDMYKHLDYIHYNPIKHGYVNSAKDWEYSSFHKFAEQGWYEIDWCNFKDKHNINILDYE